MNKLDSYLSNWLQMFQNLGILKEGNKTVVFATVLVFVLLALSTWDLTFVGK